MASWIRLSRSVQRETALEQTGGAVARERLRDAEEALQLAEQHERDVEAEYDAWRLLRQTLSEAERAQASDLGQMLAPMLSKQFQTVASNRYTSVAMTAQLATEGVFVAGAVRSHHELSVGTREQLSTLFRLCLAEHLKSVVVLDDQLVQSDLLRMDHLRALLLETAKKVQIVVLTCRPSDYVDAAALPTAGARMLELDGVRAIDLRRTLRAL